MEEGYENISVLDISAKALERAKKRLGKNAEKVNWIVSDITEFEPEHLGKLNFYLEALDRDHKKPHENPAIGVLLCASKDDEVVEYALSRSLSPAMIAEYQIQLPDKKLLQAARKPLNKPDTCNDKKYPKESLCNFKDDFKGLFERK